MLKKWIHRTGNYRMKSEDVAPSLRPCTYKVRGNDEVQAQHGRWAFYEAINIDN